MNIINGVLIALPFILVIGYVLHYSKKYPKYKRLRWALLKVVESSQSMTWSHEGMVRYEAQLEKIRIRYELTPIQLRVCELHVDDEAWFRNQTWMRHGSQI